MGSNIRRRNGVYWFRRRVPDALKACIGRIEINRSLQTTCARTAQQRARLAWLTAQAAFESMAAYKSLSAEQAELIVRRLLSEPLWDSPTAAEVAAGIDADSDAAMEILVKHSADLLPTLSAEDQPRLLDILERLVDRTKLREANRSAELAELRSEVRERKGLMVDLRDAQRTSATIARAGAVVARAVDLASVAATAKATPLTGPQSPAPIEDIAMPPTLPMSNSPTRNSARVAVEPAKASTSTRRERQKPLFSSLEEGFIREKTRAVEDHRPWDKHTAEQFSSTAHMWRNIVGDRPVDDYTGIDAQLFRDTMLRMPSSHGKGGTRAVVRATVPCLEAIRRADKKQQAIDARNALLSPEAKREKPVPRLKMKTLKRHFSALSQFWIHIGRQGLVDRDANLFLKWEYQGVRRNAKKKRLPWSTANLEKVFASKWFEDDKRGSDYWWTVLIGLFSGLRVEEIARLRPAHDIKGYLPARLDSLVADDVEPVVCFEIQPHPDPHPWNPKTEAGARHVPVHSFLLSLGFAEFVERRRAEGSYRLFTSFEFQPSSNKLSARFVRDFSKLKTSLGIGPENTFHSSRHNISTMLRNTKASDVRELWIDAILGHAGSQDDTGRSNHLGHAAPQMSEGATTYMHDIDIENLRRTVEAIQYPGVNFGLILLPITGSAPSS